MSNRPRHFLDIDQVHPGTLRQIIEQGKKFKKDRASANSLLAGKTLAMIFQKSSTRTRVSFEVGMKKLGGDVVMMADRDTQMGRGETVEDTARVLSRYVDAIMIRTDDPSKLFTLAKHATVPVINGLTDASHPCQVMADIMTFEEHREFIKRKVIAWVGDGNNMTTSWLHAAVQFQFELRIATPPELRLSQGEIGWAKSEGAKVSEHTDAKEAVTGADCVNTDTWVSMGDDDERDKRLALLAPYQVDAALMKLAKPDAIFMHCLPAHRGEEVTEDVIDGDQSVVWDEAENRLYAQMGILAWCLEAT